MSVNSPTMMGYRNSRDHTGSQTLKAKGNKPLDDYEALLDTIEKENNNSIAVIGNMNDKTAIGTSPFKKNSSMGMHDESTTDKALSRI